MELKLKVSSRLEKEKVGPLKIDAIIPAVIYGPELKNKSIKLKGIDFDRIYEKAGESSLISLYVDDAKEPMEVLVKDVQYDPKKGSVSHVDFYKVVRGKKLNTEIPVYFVGVSVAAEDKGGILSKNLNELRVECLPKDLVEKIEVDLSVLENIGDSIKIRDLVAPAGITILNDQSDSVVSIIDSRASKKETVAEIVTPEPGADADAEKAKATDDSAKKAKSK